MTPLAIPLHAGVAVVVAPHPDDETIGAGGLLFDLRKRGWTTRVVVVSDGSKSHPTVAGLAKRRERECRQACAHLRVNDVQFLGFPDASLPAFVADIADLIGPVLLDADVVLTPLHDDGHADHQACAEAVDRATSDSVTRDAPLRRTGMSASPRSGPILRWHYGVWAWARSDPGSLRMDKAFLHPVSREGLRAKSSAMAEYESQCTGLLGDVIVPSSLLEVASRPYEVFW